MATNNDLAQAVAVIVGDMADTASRIGRCYERLASTASLEIEDETDVGDFLEYGAVIISQAAHSYAAMARDLDRLADLTRSLIPPLDDPPRPRHLVPVVAS